MTVPLGGLTAMLVAMGASPLVLWLVRGRVVDMPSERSSHDAPTPRGGGISIVLGVVAGLLIAQPSSTPVTAAVLLALALGVVGLADDIRGLPVVPRLCLQVLIGAIGLFWLVDGLPDAVWAAVAIGGSVTIWVVGYTNAFNFMDGINGIAGAQLIVAGTFWTMIGAIRDLNHVTIVGLVTAGAALGFLPWNFPKARFFMGDVGSYFSGGWLAACTIVGIQSGVSAFAMTAPLFVFGADTSVTLLRRVARGEVWYRAHRDHIYQQLVIGGWSHTMTTGFYAAAAVFVAAAGLLWLSQSALLAGVGSAIAAIVLIAYLTSPATLLKATSGPG